MIDGGGYYGGGKGHERHKGHKRHNRSTTKMVCSEDSAMFFSPFRKKVLDFANLLGVWSVSLYERRPVAG